MSEYQSRFNSYLIVKLYYKVSRVLLNLNISQGFTRLQSNYFSINGSWTPGRCHCRIFNHTIIKLTQQSGNTTICFEKEKLFIMYFHILKYPI